jgi:nucleotide-binding universal stress UspA family protein
MIGSVANSLLNGAPTDVAVAPHGYAEGDHGPLREIAVGYDGAPESELALRRAEALAKRSNARLELITVVRPPVSGPMLAPGVYTPQVPPEPEKVIEAGLRSVDRALAARTRRIEGDPGPELAKACEDGTDLLVVGSRGYGPMTRVLLGSVSRQVAQKAPCPVLVARRP